MGQHLALSRQLHAMDHEREVRVAGRGVRRNEGSEEAFLGRVALNVNETTRRRDIAGAAVTVERLLYKRRGVTSDID